MLRRILTATAVPTTPTLTMRSPHLCKNRTTSFPNVPKRFCCHTNHHHRPDESGNREPIIGIDFGTSFTRVAALIDGVPQVLTDSEGQRAMPSVVAFLSPPRSGISEGGEPSAVGPLVGQPALQLYQMNPWQHQQGGGLDEQVVTSPVPAVVCFTGLKQLMGRRFEDPAVQHCLACRPNAPYAIVPCRGPPAAATATPSTATANASIMFEADPRDTDYCMVGGGGMVGEESDIRGEDGDGGPHFYSPTDLVALILAKAKATAERHLLAGRGRLNAAAPSSSRHDVPPSSFFSTHSASSASSSASSLSISAVLTCPAFFDDAQRYALRQAGQRAGLRVLRVINEPIATVLACLHYAGTKSNSETSATAEAAPLSHEKVPSDDGIKLNPPNFHVPNGAMVAVYSLGSTFSFTVLQTDSYGLFEVVASCHDEGRGPASIGGDTIDHRLASSLLQQLPKQHARSATIHPRWLAMAAEVKCALSFATEATARLDGAMDLVVTRQALEALSSDLIDRSLERCQQCLEAAALSRTDLAEVVLVGGMAHMPLVRARVTSFFGREPIGCPFRQDRPFRHEERRHGEEDRPDEAVALGAVIQGNVVCK